MKARLVLAATLALPLLVAPAAASPISYAFTGELGFPFNGSREFSGTVTFESDPKSAAVAPTPDSPTRVPGWTRVSEYAAITLNVGGHTLESPAGYLYAGVSPDWTRNPSGPSRDQIQILGFAALSPSPGWADFTITSEVPSSLEDLSDLSTLDFAPNTLWIGLRYSHGVDDQYNGLGTFTSFTPIAAPEPAAWMVALIAVGAAAARRRRPLRRR